MNDWEFVTVFRLFVFMWSWLVWLVSLFAPCLFCSLSHSLTLALAGFVHVLLLAHSLVLVFIQKKNKFISFHSLLLPFVYSSKWKHFIYYTINTSFYLMIFFSFHSAISVWFACCRACTAQPHTHTHSSINTGWISVTSIHQNLCVRACVRARLCELVYEFVCRMFVFFAISVVSSDQQSLSHWILFRSHKFH